MAVRGPCYRAFEGKRPAEPHPKRSEAPRLRDAPRSTWERNESCLQDPRPASAKRADQLADWPTTPRAFTLEQTPLIRGAVSASGCSQRDPGDRKEPRGKAWSPRNTSKTTGAGAQVPLCKRILGSRCCRADVTESSQPPARLRSVCTRSRLANMPYRNFGLAAAPLLLISRMCSCTCMARCTHWSLLWYS